MGKKLARFFIVVFIAADAYFIWQYTKGTGLHPVEAIILSGVVAAILDSASYFASSFGLTAWLEVPSINIPEIKKDKIRYCAVFFTVGLIVISGQIFLGVYRANQIEQKKQAFEIEKVDYNNRILQIDNNESLSLIDKEREKSRIRRAVYDGNEIIDYISIIVPIITTILSFALGLIGGKKYDRFEKEKERLEKKRRDKLEEYNMAHKNYEDYIGDVLRIAGINKLEENITSQKLGELKVSIMDKIENYLKKGAPDKYKSHIEELVHAFNKEVIEIKQHLSKNAEDQSRILKYPHQDEAELKDEILKLEILNDDIMKYKDG